MLYAQTWASRGPGGKVGMMPYLAGIGPLGPLELVLIAAVVIIVFGVGRLPEVGGAIGRGIREFRREVKSPEEASRLSAKGDKESKA